MAIIPNHAPQHTTHYTTYRTRGMNLATAVFLTRIPNRSINSPTCAPSPIPASHP
jgi:hypothetical protein